MDDTNKKYEVTLGNLYELNKQAMVTHPIMKDSKIEKVKSELE